MVLTPVESSNVAAVGYSADCRLLRIRYCDGAVYDYPDISPDVHAALLASESKGRFVQRLAHGVRLAATEPESARPAADARPAGPLDSYEPDDCCGGPLAKALASGALASVDTWVHTKCGMEWGCQELSTATHDRPHGSIRYWSPRPIIEVWRGR